MTIVSLNFKKSLLGRDMFDLNIKIKKSHANMRFFWQGWQDLNLRMPESKSGALPLGYTP